MVGLLRHKYLIIVIILLLSAGVRFIHLCGDAPVGDISRSGEFYVDEGTYAHNVSNKIIFGKWFLDNDYNAISNVPIFSLFQYGLLKIFGLSLFSLRSTGIIYTIATLLLLWLLLRKYDQNLAYLVMLIGGMNYFLIIYNRLALLENLILLFLIIITIFLYLYHQRNSVNWLIAAIVFFWAGYFIKATIMFYLPLIFLVIFIRPVSRMVKMYHFFIYSLMTSFVLLIIYFLWISPHSIDWHYFEVRNIHYNINQSFLVFMTNYARYLSNLKLFQFMPITYSLFLFYLTYTFYEFILKKKLMFFEWFFSAWAICGFLFLGFFKYSPPRHSVILMPAIFVLAGIFILKLYRKEIDFSDKNKWILLAPVSLLSLSQILFGFYRVFIYKQNYLSCYLPLISLLLLPLLFRIIKNRFNTRITSVMIVLAILMLNVVQIYRYYSTIQFSYFKAIQDMKATMKTENASYIVLVGDIAPFLSVELHTKAVNIILKSDTEERRILDNRPNFLVLQEQKELQRLSEKLPQYFKEVELIKTYKIFNNYRNNDDTYLYHINHHSDEQNAWVKK